MQQLLLPLAIGLGGFVGAVSRYYVSEFVGRLVSEGLAFLGTFCVNLIGCFLIGMLAMIAARTSLLSPLAQRCLLTGVLGSLTTFSTFSFETVNLMQDGRSGAAVLYVGASIAAGLLLVWLGTYVGQQVFVAEA